MHVGGCKPGFCGKYVWAQADLLVLSILLTRPYQAEDGKEATTKKNDWNLKMTGDYKAKGVDLFTSTSLVSRVEIAESDQRRNKTDIPATLSTHAAASLG